MPPYVKMTSVVYGDIFHYPVSYTVASRYLCIKRRAIVGFTIAFPRSAHERDTDISVIYTEISLCLCIKRRVTLDSSVYDTVDILEENQKFRV